MICLQVFFSQDYAGPQNRLTGFTEDLAGICYRVERGD